MLIFDVAGRSLWLRATGRSVFPACFRFPGADNAVDRAIFGQGGCDMSLRIRKACVVASLMVVLAPARGGEQPPAPEEQAPPKAAALHDQGVDTVWKRRELSFTYRSSVALFHCGALEARVRTLLIAMGARQDVSVRANNCSDTTLLEEPRQGRTGIDPYDPMGNSRSTDPFGNPRSRNPLDRYTSTSDPSREQVAHVNIKVFWPTVMTPEIIEEMRRDQSRRELISRVTKDPTARQDLPVVFRTTPQEVTLSNKTIGVEPVECELVDQFARAVLDDLGVRILRRPSCDRRSISRLPPQLVVETLMPVAYVPELPVIEDKEVAEDGAAAPESEKPQQ